MEQKKKSARTMRVLGTLLEGSGKYFAVCILLGLLLTVVEMIAPQVIRVTVDSVIDSQPMDLPAWALRWVESLGGVAFLRANMWFIALILALAGLVAALLRYGANMFNAKAGETLVKTSRDLLYHHIQHLPWKWHMQNPTGDIIQRCTSDVERIKTFFEEQFVSVFRAVAMIVFALVCMALMNWKLALVPAVTFPIIIVYSLLFHNSIRERYTACDESEGVLSTIAQENLTGVRVVRAFGREEYERQRFEKQNEDYTTLWVRLCRTLSDFWAVGDATACIQTMLVVLIGSILCVRGEMTEGEFVSFAIYNTMSISPVRRLGRVISEMSKAGVSVSRIGEILDAPCEQDKPDAKQLPMDGDIVFDHVSFRYETGPDVLSDVSFAIPAGSSFGILGGTGSGKSSLLLLLCRLYAPSEGRVMVGGEDLADMPAAWVRDHVGVVLQEPFLFSRTIEENIGICGADRETVRKAAATACIASDIEQFANGYDTMVGERGVTLSGGEPLFQPDFTKELLQALEVHKAIETSGFAAPEVFRNIVRLCDFVMMDVKLADPAAHRHYTGADNAPILKNLRFLQSCGVPYLLRVPLIPGITDTPENLKGIAALAGDSPVELLPYNKMAGAKYPWVGKTFTGEIKGRENAPPDLSVFRNARIRAAK